MKIYLPTSILGVFFCWHWWLLEGDPSFWNNRLPVSWAAIFVSSGYAKSYRWLRLSKDNRDKIIYFNSSVGNHPVYHLGDCDFTWPTWNATLSELLFINIYTDWERFLVKIWIIYIYELYMDATWIPWAITKNHVKYFKNCLAPNAPVAWAPQHLQGLCLEVEYGLLRSFLAEAAEGMDKQLCFSESRDWKVDTIYP